MTLPLTLGELRQRVAALRGDDSYPVTMVLVDDDDYLRAYLTGVSVVNDNLPDGEGGDDIHNAAIVVLFEAELAAG